MRPKLVSITRLAQEAAAGVTQRFSRSVLTVVGTAMGIGSFIAVLGVTSSANGQISADFDQTTSTQVSAEVVGSATDGRFPEGAEDAVREIAGVRSVGTWWDVAVDSVRSLPVYLETEPRQLRVIAASPGYWDVIRPTLGAGRTFDAFLDEHPVAVVGEELANSLHVADIENSPTVFIDGVPFTVIGIVSSASHGTAPLSAITIPASYARNAPAGPDAVTESLLIDTQPGAGRVVADQVALAIDAVHPERFKVVAPPNPTIVRDQVGASLQTLFFSLALICLLVGAVGITNSSLLGVMARVPEIGIRRSLGALPRHIAAQFLLEAAILGLLGGAIGASVGLTAVALVAVTQQWTAVIQPWTVVLAPLVGAVVGLLAGLYPALRASRIEPIEAFKR